MTNLATMIMEGSNLGGFKAQLTHSYDHVDGAALIAMESAEALRDIFEAEFYVPNTCTIKATLEGASCVEESSQAAIMEASVKGVFGKIKDFFIKLKNKVLDFLHQIKRYLTGIFGNDEKWVKTYEKELRALDKKALGDYEIKMYNYTIDPAMSKGDLTAKADKLLSETQDAVKHMIQVGLDDDSGDDWDDDDELKEEFDDEYRDFLEDTVGKKVDEDEVDKAIWSMFRDGADDSSDMDDVKVLPNMQKFIDAVKGSRKDIDAFNTQISKVGKMYDKCIRFIDDTTKKVDKLEDGADMSKFFEAALPGPSSNLPATRSSSGTSLATRNGNRNNGGYIDAEYREADDEKSGGNKKASTTQLSNITKVLRTYSTMVSKMQTVSNKKNTAAKTAYVERNAAYKKALTGAFAYARKHKTKK